MEPQSNSSQKDASVNHSTPGHSSGGEQSAVLPGNSGTQAVYKQHQYKRKMKKSNVVILMNVTQEVYTELLEDLKSIQPPLQVIHLGFLFTEDQVKFTMATNEDAERLVQLFEGRSILGSDK